MWASGCVSKCVASSASSSVIWRFNSAMRPTAARVVATNAAATGAGAARCPTLSPGLDLVGPGVEVALQGPRWLCLSAMFTDLANSLYTGSVFDDRWTPTVTDGQLRWDYKRWPVSGSAPIGRRALAVRPREPPTGLRVDHGCRRPEVQVDASQSSAT